MIYLQLFLAFAQIGLFSFGGGYAAVPLIQSQIVEINHCMEMDQFADLITIAEMTPGPIAINCATFVGQQVAGVPGAILCTLGYVAPPFLVALFLIRPYMKYRNLRVVQGMITGLRPAIVAMIASAALSLLVLAVFDSSLAQLQITDFHAVEAVIFVVSLVLLRKFKVHPIAVIFGSGLVGTAVYLLI